MAGHSRSLDLAQVGDTYVGGVLATGFDALVNRRANQMPGQGDRPGMRWQPWRSCGCSRPCSIG